MARRGMSGQLNMFDFFSSLDAGAPGEVEMVSLVPDFEEDEPEIQEVFSADEEEIPKNEEVPKNEEEVSDVEEVPEVVEEFPSNKKEFADVEKNLPLVEKEQKRENIAMSRSYTVDGIVTEIAYINYNKVRITKGDDAPIIKEFASTKEAVDYYVEQMQELEADE